MESLPYEYACEYLSFHFVCLSSHRVNTGLISTFIFMQNILNCFKYISVPSKSRVYSLYVYGHIEVSPLGSNLHGGYKKTAINFYQTNTIDRYHAD